MTQTDGFVYDGDWENDQPSGFGRLVWPPGEFEYIGQFKDGMMEGNGMQNSLNGEWSGEGNFSMDKRVFKA